VLEISKYVYYPICNPEAQPKGMVCLRTLYSNIDEWIYRHQTCRVKRVHDYMQTLCHHGQPTELTINPEINEDDSSRIGFQPCSYPDQWASRYVRLGTIAAPVQGSLEIEPPAASRSFLLANTRHSQLPLSTPSSGRADPRQARSLIRARGIVGPHRKCLQPQYTAGIPIPTILAQTQLY
jgi:hypothetical protein